MEGAKKGSNHSTVPMICRLWAAKWRQSHRVIAQATVPDAVHGPRRHLPQGLGRLLQPFLAGYVGRLMHRLQLQPVKAEARARR
jgi:hypothetical protein